jgi:ADP-heptose:LPS heptosyltransferase
LVHHRQDAIDNYDETAALVSALDLVISVQTAVIHLSGALGTPTWVMVPVCPEWRYGATGERMPWYGSVRLFRQRQWNDWQETIETVARELARRAT